MDRVGWRATLPGVTKSWTRLKRLSMHAGMEGSEGNPHRKKPASTLPPKDDRPEGHTWREAPVAAAAPSPSPRAPRVGGRRTRASEDTGAHLRPAGPAASPLSPPSPQPHRPPALAQKHQLPNTLPASSNLTARLPSPGQMLCIFLT